MGKNSLKQSWKSDIERYNDLEKQGEILKDTMISIMEERDDIFNKMKLEDDTPYQIELVKLIHNVIHERDVNMRITKHSLEISFTPKLQRMIQPVRYYYEWIKRLLWK